MNIRQRPKKKQRRIWLPLICGLLLAAGAGYLGRVGYRALVSQGPKPEKNPVVAPQPAPQPQVAAKPAAKPVPPPQPPAPEQAPDAKPVSASEGPKTGKARQPVFDRNMSPMAVSFKQSSVYVKPIELQDGQKAIEHLAQLLGLETEKIHADLRTEQNFVWLKRNIHADTAQQITKSNFTGVYLVEELQRYYPLHEHAAHVVGFVKDELGLAGAEFIYDPILRGNRPLISQYLNLPGLDATNIPTEGAAIVLSVDIDLQVLLEKKIQLLLQQTAAKAASAALIDGESGEILAIAGTPSYNPNIFWTASNTAHQSKMLGEPLPLAGFNAFIKVAAELAAGNLPPELALREEETGHTILPKVMKIAKGDLPLPKSQESQVWQPGVHLSPPLLWPLNYTLPPDTVSAFCAKLGLNASGTGLAESSLSTGSDPQKKDPACALDDETWRTAPLNILAAFVQLTNGGKSVRPHLLRGLWRMDDSSFQPTTYHGAEAIGPQASADFVSFTESLMPPGPNDDLIIESIQSMARETVRQQITLPSQEERPKSIEDALRFSTMTLASGRPQGEHRLALMMLVDGAKVDLNQPSPFRKAATEILNQASGSMAKRWANEMKPPKLDSDAILYQKWSLAQSQDSPRPVIESLANQEMPDLMGMSLRKAMQTLQGYNLKVNVQGSGRVSKQSPAAGARLKGVTEANLDLRMDN